MKKPKLATERMRSELSESAFFRPRSEEPQPEDGSEADLAQHQPQNLTKRAAEQRTNVQTFNRTDTQTNVRSIVRASFDIYQDQQQALAEIQTIRFKRTGKKPKMGELAQEAFDLYIRTMNEQTNG